MDFQLSLAVIRRASKIGVGLGITLTAMLAVALTTNWVDIPHTALAVKDGEWTDTRNIAPNVIPETVVAQTIRGKAVFRSNRMPEMKVIDELGRYELKGISSRAGVLRAYVKDTKRKKMHTVHKGDLLGGIYSVEEIRRNQLILRRGSEYLTLQK